MKVVISGSPGSGKTSVISALREKGHHCYDEVSRSVIQWGAEQGYKNYFLEAPVAFSEKIWTARMEQYNQATQQQHLHRYSFLDRGLHDSVAYLHYLNQQHNSWEAQLQQHTYDKVFLLPPWEAIYTKDQQRLEDFTTAKALYPHLSTIYKKYHAAVWEVPADTVQARVEFILQTLENEQS